jgi:hypothetical protein
LGAVLDHGLAAVEAACAEALEAGIASGDVKPICRVASKWGKPSGNGLSGTHILAQNGSHNGAAQVASGSVSQTSTEWHKGARGPVAPGRGTSGLNIPRHLPTIQNPQTLAMLKPDYSKITLLLTGKGRGPVSFSTNHRASQFIVSRDPDPMTARK